MAKTIASCRCQRLKPIPCGHEITQEDLLCDPCREGCNAAFGNEAKGFHMQTTLHFDESETGSIVISSASGPNRVIGIFDA